MRKYFLNYLCPFAVFLLCCLLFFGLSFAGWERTYGGTSSDGASSIIETFDGCYVIAGSSQSFGSGITAMWILKVNSSGDAL